MANSDVTVGPGVTIYVSVTEGPGVTTYNSVVSGAGALVPPDLLLMSTGIVLLMTTGSLQLV